MKAVKFDHHVQAQIFAKLRYSESLRYKDLKDPSLEPSQFMYHLKGLIQQDFVMKNSDGSYSLSGTGSVLAQHFSADAGNVRIGVVAYSLIFLRSDKGRWLVLRRRKHPHIGKYACISGKIHTDETLAEAAHRELAQIIGTNAIQLEYKGSASLLIKSGELATHIYGPVWFADGVSEVAIETTSRASAEWTDWRSLPYEQFIPGWKELIEMIESDAVTYVDIKL